ncbi:HK97 gp10 family phage protein [Croceicoccus marinus]|jgi:HK97 gp10 family phage protein|uniref:HK97 gp10 family phage protein n=1 Tax=Croceicoccus marinus TaxID=450378 RepID=A0A7G6VSH2_9SPHN|nr:HK97 gp10 family phage protein [Croceicoccus marinus]QNE04687.1 HK97 gp10 family phage protein [Croceicoccus marinus]
MATVKGKQEMSAFFANLPSKLQENVLRGAMRAAAKVVADEAKENCISEDVRKSIKISSRAHDDGRVVAKVKTAGKGAFMAPWLEYGTDPHFISAGDSGFSPRKLTQKANREGAYSETATRSLKIGNTYVSGTVTHPGARPHPFLRPALDLKGDEAIRAAQAHIDKRLAKEGYNTPDMDDAED